MSNPASVSSARRPSRFRGLFASIVALGLAVVACDRNIEPYQPGEEARSPDLARIFPDAKGGVGSVDGQVGSEEGGNTRGALPPARAEAGGAPSTAGTAITGEITLPAELAMARPDDAVLFVIARPEGVQGGPPLAVLRIPDPEFPLAFSIGPENVMIPSMQFAGAISLSARLDADGNAMTRTPGDISSARQDGLAPGASGVVLELSDRS